MSIPSVIELFDRSELHDRVALISGAQRFSYGETAAEIERLAAGLWAHGARKGDRLCIHLSNSPRLVHTIFATWRIGAIASLVVTPDSGPRLAAWCNAIDAKLLFVDDAHLAFVAPHLHLLRTARAVVSSDPASPPPGVLRWSELRGDHPPAPRVAIAGGDPLMMLRTSGTTAQPKGIWHTLDAVNARLRSHLECPPMTPDDVVCPMGPLAAVGLNITALPALTVGAKLVLLSTTDPHQAFEELLQAGVTFLLGGPVRVHIMTQGGKGRPELLSRVKLRVALTGGDKITEAVRRAWDETFHVPLLEGYGLSETLGGVLMNKLDDGDHAGNVGTPFPGIAVRIVGDDGADVPDGTPGELWCKSDYLFSGYWNEPERTREALVDGWFRTGDRAVRGGDGKYRILGRNDYLIMRGALNVSPVELEAFVLQHPAVADCMVSGFPHDVLGQDIEAFLVLREPVPKRELDAYLLDKGGALACPARLWLVPEIPRTDQGKIDRKAADGLRLRATALTE